VRVSYCSVRALAFAGLRRGWSLHAPWGTAARIALFFSYRARNSWLFLGPALLNPSLTNRDNEVDGPPILTPDLDLGQRPGEVAPHWGLSVGIRADVIAGLARVGRQGHDAQLNGGVRGAVDSAQARPL
jgi:hypothetical protein